MEKQYIETLQNLIVEANTAFLIYLEMPTEQQKIYEQKIGYERNKIVINNLYEVQSYIYLLYDPSALSKTCYIGVCYDLKDRLERHNREWDTLNENNHKKSWIKSLKSRNIQADILVVDSIESSEQWQIYESFYIAYFKSIGVNLCNGTIGGDGNPGYKHTEEAKEKMSLLKKGMSQSPEAVMKRMRQDILQNIETIKEMYNNQYSLNEIAKLYNTDHHTIIYHLKRLGIELREEIHTERLKEKIYNANTGKTQSLETKLKRSQSLQDHEVSLETRNKISTTRKELIATGEIVMPTNRAKGKTARTYRDDVNDTYLLELHNSGKSLREISRVVNMEHHSVKSRLEKLGIIFQSRSAPKQVDDGIIINLYVNGNLTFNQIAKETGKDGKYIKKTLIKNNIHLRA